MTDPFALRSTAVMHAGCHLEGCAGCVLNFRLVPTTLGFSSRSRDAGCNSVVRVKTMEAVKPNSSICEPKINRDEPRHRACGYTAAHLPVCSTSDFGCVIVAVGGVQVGYKDESKVFKCRVEKANAIVNALNRTKREEHPDLAALQEERAKEYRRYVRHWIERNCGNAAGVTYVETWETNTSRRPSL